MADVTFPSAPGIYKDRETLQESYMPETIVGRDDELETYKNALMPLALGEQPDNVFLYGKSGVGKTACTKYMLRVLEDTCADREIDLTVVNMNCEQLNTSNQVAVNIGQRLPVDFDMSEFQSGWQVYEELYKRLNEVGGTVLIVLDEVDELKTDGLNSVFYQLTRAAANEYIQDVKIGTIAITNDLTLRQDLDEDVKSSLCEISIEFPAYTAPQLYEVLDQRAEIAFEADAVDSETLHYCAAYGAQDGGDARKALDLLRKAGDIARQNGHSQIKSDDREDAREQIEKEEVVESIEGLSRHEKITMYALATLTAEDDEQHRSRKVFQRYETLAEKTDTDPLTYRRVQDYLGTFNDVSLTETESRHRGKQGGTFAVHELRHDVETVLEPLQKTIIDCGVHPSVTRLVPESIRQHSEY